MKNKVSDKAVREARLKTVRNQYVQISELQRKVRELEAEIEKLKASVEVHNHFHTHHHPPIYRYVQPYHIPPYTFTCGDNVLNQGSGVVCGGTTSDANQYSLIN